MDPRRSRGEQLGALQRRVRDAEVEHRLGVLAARVQLFAQPRRGSLAPHIAAIRSTWPTCVIGITPGMIGTSMPAPRARSRNSKYSALSKNTCVIRKSTPASHLLDEMFEVPLRAARVDVGLGEARRADRERVVGRDQLDELARVLEAALGLRPELLPRRRVPAQREHVVDPRSVHLIERRAQFRDGRANAREMRHRLEPVLLADALDDLDRLLARGAARAVGDRHERRLERLQLGKRRVQVLLAARSFRREELERETAARRR